VGHLETEKGKILKFTFAGHSWLWWTWPSYADLALPFVYGAFVVLMFYFDPNVQWFLVGIAIFCVMLAFSIARFGKKGKPRCGRWWCVAYGTPMGFEVSSNITDTNPEIKEAVVEVSDIVACPFHMPWAFGKQSESYVRTLMLNGQYKSKGSVTFEQKEGVKE
jgi:hypothetical protein